MRIGHTAAAVFLAVAACICAGPVQGAQGTHAPGCRTIYGYWCDSWRGWHFYEDPEPDPPVRRETAPQPEPPAKEPRPLKAPELATLEKLQKQLEEYRGIAIISPTEENVRRYMMLEAQVYKQASRFSEVAQRVAWSSPEFDPTIQGRPVNARALEVFDRTTFEARQRAVSELAKDHVLLFFFRSDCPYCHAFAPILEAFQRRYGIKVEAVSIDGGGLPEFPEFRRDNGIATTLNVTQVPALFIAQPFAGRITAIGFGVLSDGELLERISVVTAPGAQAIVPSATTSASLR